MKFPEISGSDIQYLLFAMIAVLSWIVIVFEYEDSNRLLVILGITVSSFLMMILIRLEEVVSLLEGIKNEGN